MSTLSPQPAAIHFSDLSAAIAIGWREFRAMPLVSMAYTLVFVILGTILFALFETLAVTPISLSFAGGFMLVGPTLLAGFFALSDRLRAGERPRAAHVLQGFRQMPRGGWVISFVCALLFLIWITDAATLYGFMIGREPAQLTHILQGDEAIHRFVLFSSIGGAILAFILFCVSAFSIPLLYDQRTTLVGGVAGSVKAVFARFPVVICWAILLSAVIIVSALILPWLLVTLPVMAYASRELYFRIFPLPADSAPA